MAVGCRGPGIGKVEIGMQVYGRLDSGLKLWCKLWCTEGFSDLCLQLSLTFGAR